MGATGDPDTAPESLQVAVIGAGLAGCLSALALARRGLAVELIGPLCGTEDMPAATALSYGSVAGVGAAKRWRELEALHGPLGWHTSAVVTHALAPRPDIPGAVRGPQNRRAEMMRARDVLLDGLLAGLPPLPVPLPFSRVDAVALAGALPGALRRAGVQRREQQVHNLEPSGTGWSLQLSDGRRLERPQVVLAAGAACRSLWPALPDRLRCSWAGVLVESHRQGAGPWLKALRRGWLVFPRRLQRPALERLGHTDCGQRWVVDVGLAPWGEGLLAGQISWLPPADERSGEGSAPDAPWLEGLLRQELARLDPALASRGCFRLVPVSYCSDGTPLSGVVAPGLWVLAGASNAYSTLPALAEALAEEIHSDGVAGITRR
jgi:glycine/D-amino acid oxidase-like deaminating enzyme